MVEILQVPEEAPGTGDTSKAENKKVIFKKLDPVACPPAPEKSAEEEEKRLLALKEEKRIESAVAKKSLLRKFETTETAEYARKNEDGTAPRSAAGHYIDLGTFDDNDLFGRASALSSCIIASRLSVPVICLAMKPMQDLQIQFVDENDPTKEPEPYKDVHGGAFAKQNAVLMVAAETIAFIDLLVPAGFEFGHIEGSRSIIKFNAQVNINLCFDAANLQIAEHHADMNARLVPFPIDCSEVDEESPADIEKKRITYSAILASKEEYTEYTRILKNAIATDGSAGFLSASRYGYVVMMNRIAAEVNTKNKEIRARNKAKIDILRGTDKKITVEKELDTDLSKRTITDNDVLKWTTTIVFMRDSYLRGALVSGYNAEDFEDLETRHIYRFM